MKSLSLFFFLSFLLLAVLATSAVRGAEEDASVVIHSLIVGNTLEQPVKAEVTYCKASGDKACQTVSEEIEPFEKFFFRSRMVSSGEGEAQRQAIFHIKVTEPASEKEAIAYTPYPKTVKGPENVEVSVAEDKATKELKILF